MSESELRRAAEHVRGVRDGTASDAALADWLTMSADHAAGRGMACESCVQQAVTVARAILGGGVVSASVPQHDAERRTEALPPLLERPGRPPVEDVLRLVLGAE